MTTTQYNKLVNQIAAAESLAELKRIGDVLRQLPDDDDKRTLVAIAAQRYAKYAR